MKSYLTVAKALVSGNAEDRRLAVEVTEFVRSMPEIQTRHDKLVTELKQQRATEPARTR